MTAAFVNVMLALSATSLGLRATALLIPRVHAVLRLMISVAIGAMFVVATLQISASYQVYDLGLGLLISLAPVGVFDLMKWWFRRQS